MSRLASQRWALAGGFAVVAVYVVVAAVEAIVSTDAMAAIPFAYAGVSIAAPLAVMWRVLGPPRPGEEGEPGDGGGGSGDDDRPGPSRGGGGEPPAPPWWPEFEREFRAHVDRRAARHASTTKP